MQQPSARGIAMLAALVLAGPTGAQGREVGQCLPVAPRKALVMKHYDVRDLKMQYEARQDDPAPETFLARLVRFTGDFLGADERAMVELGEGGYVSAKLDQAAHAELASLLTRQRLLMAPDKLERAKCEFELQVLELEAGAATRVCPPAAPRLVDTLEARSALETELATAAKASGAGLRTGSAPRTAAGKEPGQAGPDQPARFTGLVVELLHERFGIAGRLVRAKAAGVAASDSSFDLPIRAALREGQTLAFTVPTAGTRALVVLVTLRAVSRPGIEPPQSRPSRRLPTDGRR